MTSPRKLSLVSGFLLDQMYTNVLLSVVPRKAWLNMGAIARSVMEMKARSQLKWATDAADSSSMRAYRWMKKMWNKRLSDSGPKYIKVVINRQNYTSSRNQYGLGFGELVDRTCCLWKTALKL